MNPRRPAPEDLKSRTPQIMPKIDYQSQKEFFVRWLQQIKGLSPLTIKQRTRHLDKYAKPIALPTDILEIFSNLNNKSQKRHLANGFRSLFRFYEAQGLASKQWLDVLRANLPKIKSGIDINVPTEKDITDSLSRLENMKREKRVFALYNILLLWCTKKAFIKSSHSENTKAIRWQNEERSL